MSDLFSDTLPSTVADWFRTPERRDQFAADIIEQCRWLDLPVGQRGDAMREWWAASQGDHADEARRDFKAMSADERAALGVEWLGGLRASIGTRVCLAWQWHAEDETPIEPPLLVATVAALGLVAWTDDGRPYPLKAIRVCLGLPSYNDLPKFLAAARLSGDSSLTLKRVAELVDASTVANWRDDLPRFSEAGEDLIFPLGLDAVPNDPAMTPEAIEQDCWAIAEDLDKVRIDRAVDGNRRRQRTSDLPIAPRVQLFRAAIHVARHGRTVPTSFVRAMAAIMGLTSPSNRDGRTIVTPDIMRSFGQPSDVTQLAAYRDAVRLDGVVLRDHVSARKPDADFLTFRGEVDRLLADGWLIKRELGTPSAKKRQQTALPINQMAQEVGVSRNTMKLWRERPDYRQKVRDVALWEALTQHVARRSSAR